MICDRIKAGDTGIEIIIKCTLADRMAVYAD